MIKSLGKINRSGFGTKCKYRDSQAFSVRKKRFFFVLGWWYYLLCLFRDKPKKKKGGQQLPFFFDVTFSRFIRSRSGSKCLLGLTGCLVLSTTILSIQSFFFWKSFFFLCELLLRQHNDFDRRKKKEVEGNELLLE